MDSKIIRQFCFIAFFLVVALWQHNVYGANLTYMENCLRNYFSKTRHHDVDPAYKDRTMRFIRDEFMKYGLETVLQVFPDQRVSNSTNFTNVIGVLKGERFGQLDDRILGIGAHYDTVPTTPGVDDNGAAVVSMLEAIRQLTETSGVQRRNTMVFVSFDIEEEGLFGSEAFVNQWFLTFLTDNYGPDYRQMKQYGFVILDVPMLFNDTEYSQAIIGPKDYDLVFAQYFPDVYAHMKADNFRGDFISHIYRNDSDDVELAEAFKESWGTLGQPKYELETFAVSVPYKNISDMWTHRVLGNFLRSDHTRFWMQDFPALFLSDTANFRRHGSSCYHRPCDSIDVYVTDDNMEFLGKTTDSITKALDKLSMPLVTRPTSTMNVLKATKTMNAGFKVQVTPSPLLIALVILTT